MALIASTLLGSGRLPSAETVTPRKETLESQNRHLPLLNAMPARVSRDSIEPFIVFLLGASKKTGMSSIRLAMLS